MRFLSLILAIPLLISCNSTVEEEAKIDVNTKEEVATIIEDTLNPDCTYLYDTISNEDYKMHKLILDKFYDETKRGYIYGNEGDTMNVFLYDQDIGALLAQLNPNEKGIYYLLTNRVVNLIVLEDPYVLGHGLWDGDKEKYSYFMSHVGNETCEPIDLKKMEEAIRDKMNPYNERAKKNQALLLERIQSLK